MRDFPSEAVPVALGAASAYYALGRAVQYARTEPETRESIRQAWQIRRSWKRLAPELGLSIKRYPGLVRTLANRGDSKPEPVEVVPDIRTAATTFGVTVTAGTLPRLGLAEWQKAGPYLEDAWGFGRVRITQAGPGEISIRCFRREPLDTSIDSPLVTIAGQLLVRPGSLSCHDDFVLQYSEDGDLIMLNFANSAHGLVAGVTRSGKSITTNSLLAHASVMRDVRLVVIDPNLGAVAPWWRTAYRVSSAEHPAEPTEILREIRDEMADRAGLFWSKRTDKLTKFSEALPLYVVVIDEIANYAKHPDKKAREAFLMELTAVASQAAKYGIRLWLLAQKPDSAVVPTGIRTNLTSRISHRVDTTDDFVHTFSDGRDLAEEGLTAADRSMPTGVSITSIGSMTAPVRARSVYLPTEHCWAIADELCAAGLQLRELPATKLRLVKDEEAQEEAS
jgi:S-DNA-T family DNA segregation ATPase FtsK/SpoIIIE